MSYWDILREALTKPLTYYSLFPSVCPSLELKITIMTDARIPQNFKVGVAEDMNRRCRRTMEDAHTYNYDFASVPGQGFFGVFDGHAGKQAAEWCGNNLAEVSL